MEWFIALLAVAVIGLAWVAASGKLGEFGRIEADRPPLVLPESPLTAEDLNQVKFAIVPRGYAMDQVDAVMERLRDQLYDDQFDNWETAPRKS